MEDIISLAINGVLENRLLSVSSKEIEQHLSVSEAVNKLRKHSAKLKENLSSRRQDRIDPRNKQNFSIVDLVVAYDDKKKLEFEERISNLEKEKSGYLKGSKR